MTQPPTAPSSSLQDMLADLQRQDQLRTDSLRLLLDEKLKDDGHVLVTKAHMGEMDSYVGTATFRWIAQNIKLFINLPLMRNRIDEDGRLLIDEEIVNELQQRAPDWSRQPVLTYYLIRNSKRKFPAMLVVVSEDWVDDAKASEWGPGGRALKSSVPVTPLDSEGRVGILDLRSKVTIYVVDGQHRLMGISGVIELLSDGHLTVRKPDGSFKKSEKRDSVLEEFGLSDADLAGLEDEVMGVEFLPAVIVGETREEARRRIRTTFVHVNKTARPLSSGELAVLDEDDGFAIVARDMALKHRLFRDTKPGDRVNWKNTALPAGSKWLTAISTMRHMAAGYLGGTKPFRAWKPDLKGELPVRPTDGELDKARTELIGFWDKMAELPSFGDILRGGKIDTLREFPDIDKVTGVNNGGKGHVLMRPLGQDILAEAVGYLHLHDSGPKLTLDKIFEKLQRFDAQGGFENVHLPSSAWWNVTYDATRERMIMTGYRTGVDLLRYLLNGLPSDERDDLLKRFRGLRTQPQEDRTFIAYNWDGKQLTDPEGVQLPPMI